MASTHILLHRHLLKAQPLVLFSCRRKYTAPHCQAGCAQEIQCQGDQTSSSQQGGLSQGMICWSFSSIGQYICISLRWMWWRRRTESRLMQRIKMICLHSVQILWISSPQFSSCWGSWSHQICWGPKEEKKKTNNESFLKTHINKWIRLIHCEK